MKFKDLFSMNEGYEDRVKSVADAVSSKIKSSHEAGVKSDVDSLIKQHSSGHPEYKLGGRAWKDFHKDVKKAASPAIASVNRSNAAKARADNIKGFHQKLAMHINAAIGDTFPDGDPFDHLGSKVTSLARVHGIKGPSGASLDHRYDDISDHLDKAAKHNGYKGYHDQLASTWHDYYSDQVHYHEHMIKNHDPSKHPQSHLDNHKRELENAKSSVKNNPWR